jgi:hypothetical protein
VQAAVGRHNPRRTIQADRYDGSPSHPFGVRLQEAAAGPTRSPSEGSTDAGGGRSFRCRGYRDLRCCSGNHLREPPCKLSQASRGISGHGFRRSSAWNRVCELDLIVSWFRLTSEGSLVRTQLRPHFSNTCPAAHSNPHSNGVRNGPCLSRKNVNGSRRVAGQAGGPDMSEIYPVRVWLAPTWTALPSSSSTSPSLQPSV